MPKVLNYLVIIEQDEEGVYIASVPSIQGCYTQGDTYEEALKNIEEVIHLCLESRKAHGVPIDDTGTEFVGVKNVSVSYGSFANS